MHITNPKKRVLLFGDSLIWGFISGTGHRYPNEKRVGGILQKILGKNFEVIEEGLNGRTIATNNLEERREHRQANNYIIPCLDSHDPLDWIIIMLGTNDTKDMYKLSSKDIAKYLENHILKVCLTRASEFRNIKPKVIVVAPPKISESVHGKLRANKSIEIGELYKNLAKKYKCDFLDSRDLETGYDGVHITESSNKILASRISKLIH